MSENTKQRSGLGLLGTCFAAVTTALILLGVGVIGPGSAVVLSIIVILVTSGIAALLNTMKPSRQDGRNSARQRTGVLIVAGLFAISIGAMVVLVTVTEPIELVKTALGGVIVLAGTGVTAVLTMLRSDAAHEAARRAEQATTTADREDETTNREE
ncbi:Kef-type K+ transport system membrane component KefB [Prauserella sediminis]|uniref:Kef-type K+ transport system membrane component KefB n=1 Tax=Prauserella sediminis TaxID=577680 RepID=A0A839Y0W6_9PSEU|nr:hypothetical protein [Prauserella sediminis]MBB3665926.1 Kef-type K+ transport system membrane component KefB [Prauserella sediminis]